MKIDPGSMIGSALRRARLAAGVAQGDLAQTLGISIWVLSRVEHDQRPFDTDWIAQMPAPLGAAVKDAIAREVEAIPITEAAE